jgi:hypothetical protein
MTRGRMAGAPISGFVAGLLLVIAACGQTLSPTPTLAPGATPSPVPSGTGTTGGIDHATGASDLILRFEQAGGFVGPGVLVNQAPIFSLYGDGTAIFRDPATAPPAASGNVSSGVPFQVARLSEQQVQTLLTFAIDPGGLGLARARYELPIADAPTAIFTLVAGGTRKTVSVNGLGIDPQLAGADAAMLAGLASLASRLQDFAGDVFGEEIWVPDRYRGILAEEMFDPPVAWPWPTITPADFVQRRGENDPFFPIRTMTPAEVAVLGLTGTEGGITQGLALRSPAGTAYSFRLRPLLPDESY